MKVKYSLVPLRAPLRFSALPLLVILVVAVIHWPQNAAGQRAAAPKLTLTHVEELVSHGVPDSTMAAQVRNRGLAFTPTPANLEELRAKGAGPLTLAAIEAHAPKTSPPIEKRPAAQSAGSALLACGGIILFLFICVLPIVGWAAFAQRQRVRREAKIAYHAVAEEQERAKQTRTQAPQPDASADTKFCMQCGRPISRGAKFCPNCGGPTVG
jgi:hypothetical protein